MKPSFGYDRLAGSPLNPADCLAGSPMPSRCAGAQISHWTPGEEWAQELRRRSLNALEALWLDGADQFAAAERAEVLCQKGVGVTLVDSIQLQVSVGLTTRPSRSFETIVTLLEQAHAALAAIKLAGGGRWHFYNEGVGT